MNTNRTTPDANPANTLGFHEREMMLMITGAQKRLDYPTETLEMANGCKVERYLIPKADRAKVLNDLYPFADAPALDDELIDIHTERRFRVRDYIVTREGDGNFLVSPYYAEAGGTVLDWITPKHRKENGIFMLEAKTLKDGAASAVVTANADLS